MLRLEWRGRELRAGELYLTAVGRIYHGRIIVLAEGLRVFGLSEIHTAFCFAINLFLVAYNQSV